MKILFGHNCKKIQGISQVSKFCGFDSVVWNSNKSFIETINGFKPDIFFSTLSYFIENNERYNGDIVRYFNQHPECLVILDRDKLGIQYILQNKKFEETKSIKFVDIGYAANIFNGHYPYTKEKKFLISSNLRKTEQNEKLVGNLLDKNSNIPLKLFSDDSWPGEYYCGQIADKDFSCIANMSIFTLQSEESQSSYDAMLNNSLLLSVAENIPIVPVVKNHKEILEAIDYFNKNPKEYEYLVSTSNKYILDNKTYFHQFDKALKVWNLNFPILEKLKDLIK